MEGFFKKKHPQTKTKNPQPHHHHETKVLQHSNTFKYQLLLKGKKEWRPTLLVTVRALTAQKSYQEKPE